MPLRDHFRSPPVDAFSWEGILGGWPMVIARGLRKLLSPGYIAEPRAHPGRQVEFDAIETALPGSCDEYEVRVFDIRRIG